jgi:alkanesulfonate monooxygenase SsuD/methylene tetrahydromethanopterin reductase-like flavin-dependent oxidoreductase (luciferase family)
MDLMAKLGVGLMIIAQKPWDKVEEELALYRERFRALNGTEAPKPILCVMAGVSHDRAEADRFRTEYLQRYARSTVDHYEFTNTGLAEVPGYEYYGALAKNIEKNGIEKFNGFLADLQVWGNPDEVTERILEYVKRTDAGAVLATLDFGGMPHEVANANFDLYASEVLPHLLAHDVGGDLGMLHEAPAA